MMLVTEAIRCNELVSVCDKAKFYVAGSVYNTTPASFIGGGGLLLVART